MQLPVSTRPTGTSSSGSTCRPIAGPRGDRRRGSSRRYPELPGVEKTRAPVRFYRIMSAGLPPSRLAAHRAGTHPNQKRRRMNSTPLNARAAEIRQEIRKDHRRPGNGGGKHADRAARRRARDPGGCAGPGQDALRPRPGREPARCNFKRIQFTPDLMPVRPRSARTFFSPTRTRSSSCPARSLPTSCWRTKSTARRPRRNRRSWRRWRSTR